MTTPTTRSSNFTFEVVKQGNKGWRLIVKNTGDKDARRIKLSPVFLRHVRRDDMVIKFDEVESLPAGETAIVRHRTWFGDEPDNGANDMLLHLTDRYARGETYKTKLRYEDVAGRRLAENVCFGFKPPSSADAKMMRAWKTISKNGEAESRAR